MNLNRHKSKELFEEAKKMFPGGVHSPVRAFKSVYGPPLFIDSANASYLFDVDGNKYIDFCNSWGPLILGHKNPEVIELVQKTVAKGLSFGTPNPISNELGKLILQNNKYIEKIRFVSSGTEAVMSAIRLARGYSGKNKIVKFEGCYHGHVDSLMVKAGSGLATFGTSTSAGIPESFIKETIVLPLADLKQLENTLQTYKNEIAAIIIEPVPANNGLLLQDHNYLKKMRELCTQNNVLLIWDEVISGFRVGFEGAAGFYDIQPDIITYGKIIGGGMPVGAYAANSHIMSHVAPEGNVYQAGTLSANPISMAAGLATLQICSRKNFYRDMENKTKRFVRRIRELVSKNVTDISIQTIGSIFWIAFSDTRIMRSDQIDPKSMEKYKELHAFLLEKGIYLGPSGYEVGFISDAHTDEILEQSAHTIALGINKIS
ncbi:glutamate-1-semialdehyde 2,1-aminomutase [Membranihabitans maritimus]|uniref:glutamate-1-semialdehyde 2,1-aminomutase n=1 Tax=Membranihabitans maritimus TaxID=2904244 RepID=UPI001EFF9E0F|nr:glutamate-1-semialdehyde 2,1-aminomutase [Membranihabitans maritimus]